MSSSREYYVATSSFCNMIDIAVSFYLADMFQQTVISCKMLAWTYDTALFTVCYEDGKYCEESLLWNEVDSSIKRFFDQRDDSFHNFFRECFGGIYNDDDMV